MDPLSLISSRRTPQDRAADPRQVPNAAGGYTFSVSDETRLRRFLTLGTDGGTYYVGEAELTRDSAEVVLRMAEEDGRKLVETILDVSERGAAPRANPALFALAVASASSDPNVRRFALDALPLVARTGTHLFLFTGYVEQFRGWGRGLRRAVAEWYTEKSPNRLAYQVVKYRQREGWSHRDLLRLAHPETEEDSLQALFRWVTSGEPSDSLPAYVEGYLRANEPGVSPSRVASLVSSYGLSWEMLPTEALAEPVVWRALVEKGLPSTALMRQLPRLTRLGLFRDPELRSSVVSQLTDRSRLVRARVHPMNVLVAQKTYALGYSDRGSSEWTPDRRIVDALEESFYRAFDAVEPTGKRTLLALDVSGSMGFGRIAGMPLAPREAASALSLVQLSTEPDADIVGFTGSGGLRRGFSGSISSEPGVRPLDISPRRRLDDVLKYVDGLPFGPTDCALPIKYAADNGLEVDTFVVYTDNETWAGSSHPHQALEAYRRATGIDSKMVVVGMTANGSSIADPSDPNSLDVVGFDSAVPQLISDFSRGF